MPWYKKYVSGKISLVLVQILEFIANTGAWYKKIVGKYWSLVQKNCGQIRNQMAATKRSPNPTKDPRLKLASNLPPCPQQN